MIKHCLLLTALCFLWLQGSRAAYFTVNDLTAFQAALTTSASNNESDTIYVEAGTYYLTSTLLYNTSENYSLTIHGAGEATTILDGRNTFQILHLNSTGASGHLEVAHLTFEDGNSSVNGGGAMMNTDAAGIFVSSCTFTGNTAAEIGGGLIMTSFTGTLTVVQCTFTHNLCLGNDAGGLFMGVNTGAMFLGGSTFSENETQGDDAGGAMLYSDQTGSATLHYNSFTGNAAADGAGGCMVYLLGEGSNIVCHHNIYQENTALLDGAGSWNRMPASGSIQFYSNTLIHNVANEAGGGGCRIQIQEGSIDLYENIFHDNISGTPVSVEGSGGGLWIDLSAGSANINHNRFTGNDAYQNGGAAQITVYSGSCSFFRNVLNLNHAGNVGGGFSFSTLDAELEECHNTYYQNDAATGAGGAYYYFDGTASSDVYNNIFWQCTPGAVDYSGASAVTVQYSDITGGAGNPWYGTGCIDANPLFQDPATFNFLLTWANYPVNDATKSPCIDTGDPSSPTDPDLSIADMGAFYFGQNLGIGGPDKPSVTVTVIPNPVNGSAEITFLLQRESFITLSVCDVSGKAITTLHNGILPSGEHNITWDPGALPKGIYQISLTVDGNRVTKKVIVY